MTTTITRYARAGRGAVALVAAVLWLLLQAFRHPDRFAMIDLRVYRAGGAALMQGVPLYSAHPDGSLLPFTYPPFAGLVCLPLAALGWTGARVAITVASVVALVAVVRISLAHGGVRSGPVPAAVRGGTVAAVLAAALLLEPVRATLAFGQINLLLMALVLADLTVRKDRPSCGVLVGLAAAVKLTPLIFVGYLLVTGRPRAAATAAATFAGTVLAGWVLLPAESARYWFHLVAQPDRVGGVGFSGNQSLLGALTRVLHGSAAARPLWMVAAVTVGGVGLAVAAGLSARGAELAGIAVCGLTGLLVSPISWTHHWVWVLPAGIAAAARPRLRPVVAAAGLLFVLAPVWWPPHGGDHTEYRHSLPELLLADSYVLAALAVIAAGVAAGLSRDRGGRSVPAGTRPGPSSA
jgi:alpha-1,2-mannosyltransferase